MNRKSYLYELQLLTRYILKLNSFLNSSDSYQDSSEIILIYYTLHAIKNLRVIKRFLYSNKKRFIHHHICEYCNRFYDSLVLVLCINKFMYCLLIAHIMLLMYTSNRVNIKKLDIEYYLFVFGKLMSSVIN